MTTGNSLTALKIKMQNLKTEIEEIQNKIGEKNSLLKEESVMKAKINEEIELVNKKIKELDEATDEFDGRFRDSHVQLEDVSKLSDINERTRRGLENRQLNNEGKIEKLENQLKDERNARDAADIKYKEIALVLKQTEGKLADSEDRLTVATAKLKDMELDMNGASCSLKSMELNKCKATEREENYEKKISQITDRLNNAKLRLSNEEAECGKFTALLQSLEDDIEHEQQNHEKLRTDLDKLMEEFQNI